MNVGLRSAGSVLSLGGSEWSWTISVKSGLGKLKLGGGWVGSIIVLSGSMRGSASIFIHKINNWKKFLSKKRYNNEGGLTGISCLEVRFHSTKIRIIV